MSEMVGQLDVVPMEVGGRVVTNLSASDWQYRESLSNTLGNHDVMIQNMPFFCLFPPIPFFISQSLFNRMDPNLRMHAQSA